MEKKLKKYYRLIREIYTDYKEVINYLIVGVLTTVVSIVSFAIFQNFALGFSLFGLTVKKYMVSTVLSWIVAVLFAYVTNRKFVFESHSKKVVSEFIKFVTARIMSLLAEIVCMYILIDLMHSDEMIAKILVQVLIIVLNYVFSKLFVFKK